MENEIFSSRDIYLAATLVTLKFEMIGIDYMISGSSNLPIGFFKFQNNSEIEKAKSMYIQGALLVEPKTFVTNLKSLKSEIQNRYSNPHEQK